MILKDANVRVIHQDGEEQLLSFRFTEYGEPTRMVKVIDTTTKKPYLLRVPPDVNTVLEAKAWTFDLQPSEYYPLKEA